MSTKNNNQLSESVFTSKSAEYDKHYNESNSRYSKEKQERLKLTLKNISAISTSSKVIDIGCGTGILLNKLLDEEKKIDYVGVDSSAGMIKIAKKKIEREHPKFFQDIRREFK